MANYNQSPYGMPYAPPQNQPPPPFGQQQQQQQAYTNFWNTFHGQGQPSSLPPPPFPPLSLGQNGYPMPPPLPPAAYPNAFFPLQQGTPPFPVPDSMGPSPFAPSNSIAPNNRIMEITEAEKEEGELTEGDRVSQSPASQHPNRVALPRSTQKQPVPSQQVTGKGQIFNTERKDSSSSQLQSIPASILHDRPIDSPSHPTAPSLESPRLASQSHPATNLVLSREHRERAKNILSLLNANNVGYEQLIKEPQLSPELLQELYEEMGIPVPAHKPIVPPKVSLSQTSAKPAAPLHTVPPKVAPSQAPAKPATSLPPKPVLSTAPATNRNVSTASVPSPVDRKEYLARLQAARSAKTQSLAKEPQRESPAAPVIGVPTTIESRKAAATVEPKKTPPNTFAPIPATTAMPSKSNGTETATSEKNKAITELARQKLAALANAGKASPSSKAAQPSSAGVSSDATPAPPSRSSSLSSAIYASGQEQAQATASASHSSSQSNPSESTPAANVYKPSSMFQQQNNQLTSPPTWMPPSGGIPGLFMTGSGPPVGASQQPPSQRPQVQRPPSTPFGQPRHYSKEHFVIDLSDDETETVVSGMDIDDRGETNTAEISGKNASQPQVKEAIRNLPPLANFPSHATSAKQATSGISTPPAVQTPGSQASLDDLKRKEKEIAAMRRKIAEAEKRKAANKSKQTENSRPASPAANLTTTTESGASQPLKADAPVQAPEQSASTASVSIAPVPTVSSVLDAMESLSATGNAMQSTQGEEDATIPPLPANATESLSTTVDTMQSTQPEPGAPVKSPAPGSDEWKRTRRAKIQSDLPSLDARLASDTARMEELKREMQLLEAENQRRIQDKANLVRELESLGIDTEGMPHEELQARKDEIVQQREMETNSLSEIATKDYATSPGQYFTSNTGQAPIANEALDTSDILDNEKAVDDRNASLDQAPISSPNRDIVLDEPMEDAQAFEIQMPTNHDDLAPMDHVPTSTSDHKLAVNEPVEHSVGFPSSTYLTTSDRGPESHEDVSTFDEHSRPAHSAYDTTSSSDEESDDMEISDDESGHGGVIFRNSVEPVVLAGTSSSSSGVSTTPEDAEDFYSPDPATEGPTERIPDAQTQGRMGKDDIVLEDQDVSLQEGVASPQTQAEVVQQPAGTPLEEGEIEMSESSDAGDDNEPEEFISQPVPKHDELSISTADDLAAELQPTKQPWTQAPSSALAPDNAGVVLAPFKPYESPLRLFKSYRNHPDYTSNVQGGYRSMTYSHQIDPNKPLCRFEAAGGTCNDNTCDSQHFREMELSADMILVQLGTANPGHTEAEKQQFKEGLKSIIKDLRSKNTSDPEIIAEEFSKYRRRFLNDDTRVLNLPD